jgi:hypothetical protein
MSKKDKDRCPYELSLSEEEMDALSWLGSILQSKMERRFPFSKKYGICHEAIGKLLSAQQSDHELLHQKDQEIEYHERMILGLLRTRRFAEGIEEKDMN